MNPSPTGKQEVSRAEGFEFDLRDFTPFLIISLVLVAMVIWALATVPELRAPQRWIPFLLLTVLHGGLYWLSLLVAQYGRLIILYFIVQAAMVFFINLLVPNQGFLLGLYMGLIGLIVGILEDLRVALIGVVALLALATVNYGVMIGWPSVPGWFAFFGPMALFVVLYVAMFMRESRARRQSQQLLQELETTHRKLSEYAARVEDLTLEAERQRLARELHDTLAQGLAGLILQLEAVEAHLINGSEARAAEVVSQAKGRARAVLHDARNAIHDLRETRFLPGGVTEAIRIEVDRFIKTTGIPCELEVPAGISLASLQAEHVLRLVAEGLTNTARHARAQKAWVRLSFEDDRILAEVGDDGQGFEPAQAMAQPGHYGLVGLRERARLAGGELDVESAPQLGSVLRLWLPMSGGAGDV